MQAKRSPITHDSVHVWIADLAGYIPSANEFLLTLSPDEQVRADRFVFELHRGRFIACRGILRDILGHYTGVAPKLLRFDYNTYGKPELASDPGRGQVKFNISHSAGLAAFAITSGRRIGIDIEHVRPLDDLHSITKRFFSASEQEALANLAPEESTRGFFSCWTRKEAFIKAKGMGLSIPLDSFDVSVHPDEPPRLLRDSGDPGETEKWSMAALRPSDDYVGALAVEGAGWQLAVSRWS
jgi:4'-phosphopantetheinyl transferase